MGQLGPMELLIIGLIALLVFGPKKLPELGSGLGKAIRDFKGAMSGKDSSPEEEKKEAEKKEAEKQEKSADK